MSTRTLAIISCMYAGAVWGLYWLPLRALAGAGIAGPWVGVVFLAVPMVCLAPVAAWRWRRLLAGGPGLQLTALLAGAAMAFYTASLVMTDVIRALALFYLTPIWSTLLARAVLGEAITWPRVVAIALALAGMGVIFGAGGVVPMPRSIGDWFGLLSGIVWAAAAVRLNADKTNDAIEITFLFAVWAVVISTLIIAPVAGAAALPDWSALKAQIYWAFPTIAILTVPGVYATMWGPRHLEPGIVGLLFMTEITAGAVSVALWADEPFGWREAVGVTLISLAGIYESLLHYWRTRTTGNSMEASQ